MPGLVAPSLVCLTTPAAAEATLDVEHDPPLGGLDQATAQLADVFDVAQSFTVGRAGALAAVEIRLVSASR